MGSKYQYVFNRLKKLERTLENICNENIELGKANSKLRTAVSTLEQTADARERVLQSFTNEHLKLPEQELQTLGDTPTDGGTDQSTPT